LFLPFSIRIFAITVAANRMRTSRTKANANARQQVIKNHKFQFKFILLWLWILDFAMSGQVGALCIHLLGFVCLFMSMYKFYEFFNSSFVCSRRAHGAKIYFNCSLWNLWQTFCDFEMWKTSKSWTKPKANQAIFFFWEALKMDKLFWAVMFFWCD